MGLLRWEGLRYQGRAPCMGSHKELANRNVVRHPARETSSTHSGGAFSNNHSITCGDLESIQIPLAQQSKVASVHVEHTPLEL